MLTPERTKEIIWNTIQLLSKARQELNPGANWKEIGNQIFIDLNLTPDELDEIINEYPWDFLTPERSKEIIWNAIQLLSKARQELNIGTDRKAIAHQIFIDLNLTPDEERRLSHAHT